MLWGNSKRYLISLVGVFLFFLFRYCTQYRVKPSLGIINEVDSHYPVHPTHQCKPIYGEKDSNHHVIRVESECNSYINHNSHRKKISS
jgi:hypothetical protein